MSRVNSISDEEFKRHVEESVSYNQLSTKCGYGHSTSKLNKQLYKRIVTLRLYTGHFKGKRWAKGLERPECNTRGYKLEDILVKGIFISGQNLKRKLIKEMKWKDECVWCKIGPSYNGKPITLQLDHINGNNTDNRIENLRILCPNCHSQTNNWCSKKITDPVMKCNDPIIPQWLFK